jgi:TolB-like protein/Tfp pilus assembly protein PilF/predicted Ser/Thr protein kinase
MIGKTISHYRILEKLGEGGMGVVYKAEDTELQRMVALKFLPAGALDSDEERERFIHEARAAASIDHASVCTVHEIGKAEGRIFIAMAYVDGSSLKSAVDVGPMKLDEAIDVAIQVAEGLQAAHERGVVHRDIKPANLMLTSRGRVKIMDFGLAKSPRGVVVTKTSTTLGTVAYMSPEQARGEQVDGRSDIYSLGAVLYEMVTGRRPFTGDYDQAVIYSILNAVPEPVTALRTGVPRQVERVILRCLEKDPADRYQTAADLISDLRRSRRLIVDRTAAAEDGEVATGHMRRDARPSGTDPRAGVGPATSITEKRIEISSHPPRRSYRWALIVTFVTLVAIAAVVLVRLYTAPHAGVAPGELTSVRTTQPTPDAASAEDDRTMIVVLPFENLGPSENAYFAAGITEEITSRLACVRALGVISRTSAVQYDRTGKTVREIGEDLGVDYVLEGTVRWDGAFSGESRVRVTPQLIRVSDDTHVWAHSYDRELQDIFAVQSEIAAKVVGQMGVTLLDSEKGVIETRPTRNMDAYHAYLRGMEYLSGVDPLKGNLESAQEMFERAVALDPDFGLAYAGLSEIHSAYCHFGFDRSPGRRMAAEQAAERSLELAPELPDPHIAMGYYYYWALDEYDKALAEFAAAKNIRPNDPRIIEAEGYILRRKGDFQDAIDRLKQALLLDPRSYRLPFEIGMTYNALRGYSEARDYFKQSISLAPEQKMSYAGLAQNILLSTGDPVESRRWLEKMGKSTDMVLSWFWLDQELIERDYEAALQTVNSAEASEDVSVWLYSPKPLMLAEVYDLKGETTMARAYYDSARVLLEGILETDPERDSVHIMLALAYAGLDRKADAIREGEKALEVDPIMNDAFERPFVFEQLANVYTEIGEYDLALDWLEKLLTVPSGTSTQRLRLEPQWDPLRDTPRFQSLLEEYSRPGS